MDFKTFYSLQLKTSAIWEQNLQKLEEKISLCKDNSFILASEVFLTGFAYQKMQEAHEFSVIATRKLQEISLKKTIGITMIEKIGPSYVNRFKIFHKGCIKYTQQKVKLFPIGNEHLHFKAGKIEDIQIFDIDGVSCAVLNCFEIRFIELWQKIQGAQVIFIPAAWGKTRKVHFQTLTRALAIVNQSFVIASSCAGHDYAKGSCIITPYGIVYKNDSKDIIEAQVDLSEVEKMRTYINTGISH
ncbi:carbon-nitrogen hydrolase family protein [Helicobacter didelphidarum]|nr:carbon-nitrogen hydrolase family protein [Helicobacter didelphidarum]